MRTPKILFTTPFCEAYYDYFRENSPPAVPRLSYPRMASYGLRFIKQNLPFITILEYPTWEQYAEIVSQDWDIVGFSFFTPDFPRIRKMVQYARMAGVPQLWGGSYGSLIPEAGRLFDMIVTGYGERAIAEILGREIPALIHPPIVDAIGVTGQVHLARTGVLFTSRGCPFTCTFCQTPIFTGGARELLPLEAIQRVLSYYKSINVSQVLILDETFGLASDHSRKVAEMLKDFQLSWLPMTRTDILNARLDSWLDCGMAGALLGVENLQQQNIQDVHKGTDLKTTFNVIDRLLMQGRFVVGFYMIGFENETVPSIQKDIHWIANQGLDLVQVCVVTPLHGTPLFREISSKFGPIEPDLSLHTTKNLVWNHPHISKGEMARLLPWTYEQLHPHYQLEYSQSKYFQPGQFSLASLMDPQELSVVPMFRESEVVTEPRLSPCRFSSTVTGRPEPL
jgi:radical SAM superfamily enzyme YgiQ (UPF0313 family)